MLKKAQIAIEFGSRTIKILKLSTNLKSNVVDDYRIIDVLENSFDHNDVPNLEILVPQLSTVFTEMGIKRGNVNLTLTSKRAVARTREMPKVPISEMKEMVVLECDQFLPYSSDEFYIDYRIISEIIREDNVQMFKAYIVAVPCEVVDAYSDLFMRLKLNLTIVSVSADTTYMYIERFIASENQNFILADIGYETMNMIVYKHKELFVNLSANCGIKEVLDVLKMERNLSYDEALLYLTEHNSKSNPEVVDVVTQEDTVDSQTSEESSNKLSVLRNRLEAIKNRQNSQNKSENTTRNPVDLDKNNDNEDRKMVENHFYNTSIEIKRMVDFFRSREFGARIDGVYLMGGGASIMGICEYLVDSLEIPVSKIDIQVDFDVSLQKKSDGLLLIPALGVSLGGSR